MLERFTTIINTDLPNISNKTLFVAISGGVDSMVLAKLLLQNSLNIELLHCNFNLRGYESNQDEKFIAEFAKTNDIKLRTINFDTIKLKQQLKLSTQETARKLRYDWFNQICSTNPNALILTAHHLDDSIETFFINLLRGTGIEGIKGINKNTLSYYRPLLNFTSEEIYSYANLHNIKYREDSSNSSNEYLRNNLRNNVLPIFEELDNSFKIKMSAFFNEMNEVNSWINQECDSFRIKNLTVDNDISCCKLLALKDVNTFFIQKIFQPFGIHRKRLPMFISFLSSNTGAQFNTLSHRFLINRKQLLIEPINNSKEINEELILEAFTKSTIKIGFFTFSIVDKSKFEPNKKVQYLDLNKIKFPLKIRPWINGDRIKPLGMNGHKLVSDILINKKIDLFQKESIYVIIDSDKSLVSISNVLISENVKIDPSSNLLLAISTS